jgi:homoserine O-acetyltransferase/O-succinyltransferase
MRATTKPRPRARLGIRAIIDTGTKVARLLIGAGVGLMLSAVAAVAADYPTPEEADFIARAFRFHTGEVMPELRLHYTTIGAPSGEPVLILHGTAGSGTGLLTPAFAGELFGPGQPLDANKYFIILPDALGAGKSSKPSDGLRAKFPRYNYDDMVAAQYQLVTEGLGLRHLRLILGNSMGGMHVWVWATTHPASWTPRCRWPRSRPKWRAAIG